MLKSVRDVLSKQSHKISFNTSGSLIALYIADKAGKAGLILADAIINKTQGETKVMYSTYSIILTYPFLKGPKIADRTVSGGQFSQIRNNAQPNQ
jgi:hypothetical protein